MVHPRSVDLASELIDAGFTLIGATMDGVDLKIWKIEKLIRDCPIFGKRRNRNFSKSCKKT